MSARHAGNGGRLVEPAAALLVGGASSRMGRDKATLPMAGDRTLAVHLLSLLSSLFEDCLVVGGEARTDPRAHFVPDPTGPQSALRGIVAALEATTAERVLVVATDMPGLTADLLLALVAAPEADVVLPREGERWHPLCAIYRRERVLPAARRAFDAGELALRPLLAGLELQWLEGDDLASLAPERALANVNTPEEWAAFEAST